MLLEELVLPLKVDSAPFKAGLAVAAAGVAALVAGMGLAIKATFKWADELDSITDIMGVSNKTAAALNFTLRKSGVATETLTKGMTILAKGLVKADGSLDTTGKSLKAWGINVLDANGMLKDQTALIGDISDKYNSFATQQEKVNFLTETFGRSGAELIDFFDTLAGEGGLDAVTEKMERFGLAIDPNRYEQFNRNLEELKLIGLGLAVAFTEKVMPALEKFLEFVSDPKGIDLSKIAEWADTTIAKFVKGLGDSINDWTASGGPEALSESLIAWIEGIGDESRVKSKIEIAMGHLVQAMGNALAEVDWSGIWAAIDTKLDELDATMTPAVRTALDNVDATFNAWMLSTAQKFATWSTVAIPGALSGFGSAVSTMIGMALTALKNNIDTKLREISKEFYNRALAWAQKAAEGFSAGKEQILKEIRMIVNAVNIILKKIITTFTLSFNTTIGTSGSSNLGGGVLANSSGSPDDRGASGGALMGGQKYLVGELGPELFVPNESGRLIPNNMLDMLMGNKQQSLEIDYDRLGSLIAGYVIKGLNNA